MKISETEKAYRAHERRMRYAVGMVASLAQWEHAARRSKHLLKQELEEIEERRKLNAAPRLVKHRKGKEEQ